MWTPGYWAWDGEGDYYWIAGTWVAAPQPGYLWTPGYWGWGNGGAYIFHGGYWGTQVGFYGGVNYGFGYGGGGFAGGEWRGRQFAYNTAAVNVNTTSIHNTYVNTTVINNTTINNTTHTSFNGGPNGVAAKPTAQQQTIASEPHLQPTAAQQQHQQVAKQDKSNFASTNHGVPAHAALARPATNVAELQHSAVAAKTAPGVRPYSAPAPEAAKTITNSSTNKPVAAVRPLPNTQPADRAQTSRNPAANSTATQPSYTARPAPPAPRTEPAPKPAASSRLVAPPRAKQVPHAAPPQKGREPMQEKRSQH